MRRDELRHLEHRDFALPAEDGFQLVIREDIAFVCRILKIILLDVFPKLLDHFGSRERPRADDRREFRRKIKRLR